MTRDSFHNDDFFDRAVKQQRRFAVLGLLWSILCLLVFCLILYFFLAAAGVVPRMDVVPILPFI